MGEARKIDTARLREVSAALARLDQDVDNAERLERIRLLEDLKFAISVAQVRDTLALAHAGKALRRR